jgi:hypothetical protein
MSWPESISAARELTHLAQRRGGMTSFTQDRQITRVGDDSSGKAFVEAEFRLHHYKPAHG